MRLFPELQRAQLRLLEQQSGSWLRGNPWQCDFNLKSQISMPGTQAARALRAAVPPTSYAPASSDTRRRHHLQACYTTAWALLLLGVHLLGTLGVAFLKIKGLTDDHTNASTALGDEKCTAGRGLPCSISQPIAPQGAGSKCRGCLWGPSRGGMDSRLLEGAAPPRSFPEQAGSGQRACEWPLRPSKSAEGWGAPDQTTPLPAWGKNAQ